MMENALNERPFLKDIVDDLIRDIQHARLREDVLPLDRYAQSEVIGGRVEVTVNSRIAEIPGVRYASGTGYVAKWHESIHVSLDLAVVRKNSFSQAQCPLPGFEVEPPQIIVCRTVAPASSADAEREFIAENAGLAAAIAQADLERSSAFVRFQRLVSDGLEHGGDAWRLLYDASDDVGVNITALVRYSEQRGLFRVTENGRRRIIAAPRLFGGMEWM
jgi:hypothetical protein